jgi:hypothetical protein
VPAPTPTEQVEFLRNLQRLLDEGSFTASYKFALLRALADLALLKGDDDGGSLTLTTREIAEKFVELYWRQVAPFPALSQGEHEVLHQNTGRPAAILAGIAGVRAKAPTLPEARRSRSTWSALVGDVARTVQVMPLWKLQTVGREKVEFLYPNVGSGDRITLRPGVASCFRAFHPLVVDLVHGAWLRFVRRVNRGVLGTVADLEEFLFGSERGALQALAPCLREAQRGACFYCRSPLRDRSDVDHFVPWARYPADLAENLVLAHPTCNASKSDLLAAETHLDGWVRLQEERGPVLRQGYAEARLSADLPASRRVAAWAYGQVEQARGQVWRGRSEGLGPLTGTWRKLLST